MTSFSLSREELTAKRQQICKVPDDTHSMSLWRSVFWSTYSYTKTIPKNLAQWRKIVESFYIFVSLEMYITVYFTHFWQHLSCFCETAQNLLWSQLSMWVAVLTNVRQTAASLLARSQFAAKQLHTKHKLHNQHKSSHNAINSTQQKHVHQHKISSKNINNNKMLEM